MTYACVVSRETSSRGTSSPARPVQNTMAEVECVINRVPRCRAAASRPWKHSGALEHLGPFRARSSDGTATRWTLAEAASPPLADVSRGTPASRWKLPATTYTKQHGVTGAPRVSGRRTHPSGVAASVPCDAPRALCRAAPSGGVPRHRSRSQPASIHVGAARRRATLRAQAGRRGPIVRGGRPSASEGANVRTSGFIRPEKQRLWRTHRH